MVTVAKLSCYRVKFLKENVPSMRRCGRVQQATIAGNTIFDLDTVTDNSDYPIGKAGLPSTWVLYVIVNSAAVVLDSRVPRDVYPGQLIRGWDLD